MTKKAFVYIITILIVCLAGCGGVQPASTPDPASDGMISIEAAEAIALEKANSMASELAAENIRLDDSEPSELMTLKDTTVWAVRFTFNKLSDSTGFVYGGLVMVDAFSGEVFRVYLST